MEFIIGRTYENPYHHPPTAQGPPSDAATVSSLQTTNQVQVNLQVDSSTAGRNICQSAKHGVNTCGGKKIKKKELRIGMNNPQNGKRIWRHWRCMTQAFIDNMKFSYPSPEDLPGFGELSQTHQARVRSTYKPSAPRRREISAEAIVPIRHSARLNSQSGHD
ncbi:hypothetical protein BDZ94DRAFT_1253566 [Collybia nuda]|uniref:PARP-type domain-containing protein n=1 Tax=Collybia nuda TaxID=64659 RepID=A0A9P5Y8Q7_9AGAR|nr:hypothetical protein BDZ94DRAFT_1253566 [Collybia nuda]